MPTPADREPASDETPELDPDVALAVATWPEIDPAVETIVDQVSRAFRLLDGQMRESLDHVGLTKEEFKVLMQLHSGPQTHGALCKTLHVSTGAMTNRLDKLERDGLVSRSKDPHDRRGVLLTITADGRARLDAYIERGAHREKELLGALSASDKRTLARQLGKLLDSLQSELG
jgi:DNA-binding MarR family transcriptional regulator